MILPSKHLSVDRALLTVGAHILLHLNKPKTISAVWDELLCQGEKNRYPTSPMRFDQFVLALDVLFLMDAIELVDGLLRRKGS